MKTLRKLKIIISCICVFSIYIANSQAIPKFTPMSPGAAALTKYINYPVNHSTGLVDITIPIFTIQDGDITLPITLSYHASGLKVADQGDWVGAGWTLNVEPSISRSVDGSPDENYYLKKAPISDPYNMSVLNQEYWANGNMDAEPDKFYYRLAGKSGEFYFEKVNNTATNQIRVHPYEPIKIGYSFNNDVLGNFEICDDNGILYTFGDNLHSISTSHSSTVVRNQWKATSIVSSRTLGKIDFYYGELENKDTYNLFDKIIVEERTSVLNAGSAVTDYISGLILYGAAVRSSIGGNDYFVKQNGQTQSMSYETIPGDIGSTFTREAKIKEIAFSGGYINFNKSGNKITSIIVTNTAGAQIKKITFSISDMGSGVTRNKLNSISVLDKNNNVEEQYHFNYHEPNSVPSVKSKAVDHWGYFNGAYGNDGYKKTAVPRQSLKLYRGQTIWVGDANREPNEEYMKYGILTSIKYPTGGWSEFEYEAHRYTSSSAVEKITGGLRIKKITDYSPESETMVKEYVYGKGIYGMVPLPEYYIVEQHCRYKTGFSNEYIITSQKTFSSNIGVDLYYDRGSPVVYNEVKEIVANKMETVYNYAYSSGRGYITGDASRRFIIDERDSWQRAHLKSKQEYKRSSSFLHLVRNTEYIYDNGFKNAITRGYKMKMRADKDIPFDVQEPFCIRGYNIYTGGKRLIEEKETLYFDNHNLPVINKTTYTYDKQKQHLYPEKIEKDIDGAKKQITEFKYPEDF